MVLEVCAFNLAAALVAERAGADRIEFCSGPEEGGVTPSAGLIRMARSQLRIPVYPIIRPREGDFLYSEEEFRVMELIDTEQEEHVAAEDRDAKSFQELLIRKVSRR